jgi:hypothetical protein
MINFYKTIRHHIPEESTGLTLEMFILASLTGKMGKTIPVTGRGGPYDRDVEASTFSR